jgi:toxin ParE1/3/4
VVQDIRDKIKALLNLPYMGKVVPEIGEPSLREISLYSYRILYEVMDEAIYIHGVIHMRRNFIADDLERSTDGPGFRPGAPTAPPP